MHQRKTPYLRRLLIVLDVVPLDVVVRTNRLPQFRANDNSGTFGAGPTSEEHDPRARIGEGSLKQANSDTQRHTGTPERPLVVRNRPGILLQLLEGIRQLELAALDWEKEPRGGRNVCLRASGNHGLLWAKPGAEEAEHLLHLLRGVLLVATEYVGFGALGVSQFMDMCLARLGSALTLHRSIVRATPRFRTIVPKVINPTKACGGSKLKLMISESLRALRESSSWHVSTTNRKIGGAEAGRASLYSIVEYAGESSRGHAFGPMSL